MKKKINNLDLLYECYEIYDNNEEALFLHIYTLAKNKNRKIDMHKIKKDLKEQKNLDNYRIFFNSVLDSFKSEIEEYIKISKFEFSLAYTTLNFCYENLEVFKKIDNSRKNKIKSEIVDMKFFIENIIDEVIS